MSTSRTPPGSADKLASELVGRFASVLRNAEIHDPNNRSWKGLLGAFATALAPLLARDRLARIESRGGRVSVNGSPVRPGFSEMGSFNFLGEEMAHAGVASVEFRGVPDEVEIKKFAYAFTRHAQPGAGDFPVLAADLESAGVRRIVLIPLASEAPRADVRPVTTGAPVARTTARGARVLLLGIAAVKDVMDSLRAGTPLSFTASKRFVHEAIDLLAVDRGLLLALTTAKNFDDYLYSHSVNVCLLSLAVGAKLGFDRAKLADLGLSALLRDVGKALVPKELLEKQGALNAEEWKRVRAFPFAAVLSLFKVHGLSGSGGEPGGASRYEGSLRQAIVAFEHKFKDEASAGARDFNLFSKIASLADSYDAMTTPRPYRPFPVPPDQALRNLVVERHNSSIDPVLIKAFIHAIGLYPVGSVVILDTNEVAIVAAPPMDMTAMARPRVRIVSDPAGNELSTTPIVDLTAFDERSGRYRRSIASTIDPWNYGINVPRHLLADEIR